MTADQDLQVLKRQDHLRRVHWIFSANAYPEGGPEVDVPDDESFVMSEQGERGGPLQYAMTLSEVAQELGLCRSRVQQIEQHALRKIARQLHPTRHETFAGLDRKEVWEP